MIQEIWKPVIYRDIKPDMYEVSNLGNFRNTKTGHMMTPCPSEKGYMMIAFRCLNNKTRSLKIHRIIAWMFVPGYDEINNEVDHKDGNKTNNYASNLEWVTREENIRRGFKNNLIPAMVGERNGMHILTDDNIHHICEYLLKFNGDCKRVHYEMKRLGYDFATLSRIQCIKYKKNGKHISDQYFDENRFPINHRIMGDDVDIVCQDIITYNGDYDMINEHLKKVGIRVSPRALYNIISKISYNSVSDKYFVKGEYTMKFNGERINDYRKLSPYVG